MTPSTDREKIEAAAREILAQAHEPRKYLVAVDIRTGNIGRQGVAWVETETAIAAIREALSQGWRSEDGPTEAQVDDAVSAWHNGAGGGLELHQYLGWSWEEYSRWVSDASAIPARPLPTPPTEEKD